MQERVVTIAVTCSLIFLASCGVESTPDVTSKGAITADHANCFDGDPGCGPTGAHEKHGRYPCTVCHKFAGRVVFDASGPAYGAGERPTFDAVNKTCSNVACHRGVSGTYTFMAFDGDNDYEVNLPYSSDASATLPAWYATGAGCGVCHNYPPTAGGMRYAWHSGSHAMLTTDNANTCQFCHPDATGAFVWGTFKSTSGGLIPSCATGTFCSAPGAVTNAALHGNGVVDVQVNSSLIRDSCYPCH
jgi:predicted CxxxxCH...CXXCH cytochrome family protein